MPPKGKQKPKASVISGPAFYGTEELTRENLETLRFLSPDDAVAGLIHNWNGGILGLLGVNLSPDNCRIQGCTFSLAGKIFEGPAKSFNAARFFTSPPVKFLVHEIDVTVFKFPNSLTSDFVDGRLFNCEFKQGDNSPPLTAEALKEMNIDGFCLRAYVHPTADLYAKCIISLYPLPLERLKEAFPLADNTAFPGFTFWSNQFPLVPSQTDIIKDLDWGLPLLPAIFSALDFDEAADIPTTSDLRAAVCTLLRSATLPDNKQNTRYLTEAWAKITASGESALKSPPLKIVWPAPRAPMSSLPGRTVLFRFYPPPCLYC